jgi:DNA-binding NarL/FixJ family response regulator
MHLVALSQGDMARTVLIVDDNAFVREALWKLFQREPDLEVCGEAENGREAIDQARRLHPDLIVMDLSMPVMNGLDAARAVKRLLPAVPVIMYSAFEDRVSEQQARMVGISALVSKSENVSVLIAKARGLLYARPLDAVRRAS